MSAAHKGEHLKPHQFQPGNTASPGRGKNWFKSLDLKDIASRMFKMSVSDLQRYAVDPDIPVIDAIMGKVLLKAIEHGDAHRLEFVLNRILGRVKDIVEETDENGNRVLLIERPDGSVVRLGVVIDDAAKPDQKLDQGTEGVMPG